MKDIPSKRRKEVLLIQDNAFGDAVIFIKQINPGLSLFHIDNVLQAPVVDLRLYRPPLVRGDFHGDGQPRRGQDTRLAASENQRQDLIVPQNKLEMTRPRYLAYGHRTGGAG